MERRFVNPSESRVSIETRADGKRAIVGYAAVFYNPRNKGTQYDLFPGIVERVAPTAFDRALADKHDVRGLINHDPNIVLGRTAANTMTLEKDDKGLRYIIPLDDNVPDHARYSPVIARGDMSGSSFGFRVTKEEWSTEKDVDIRLIADVDLYDVSPVTFPAYEATSTALRSADGLQAVKDAHERWKAEQQHRANLARAARFRSEQLAKQQ